MAKAFVAKPLFEYAFDIFTQVDQNLTEQFRRAVGNTFHLGKCKKLCFDPTLVKRQELGYFASYEDGDGKELNAAYSMPGIAWPVAKLVSEFFRLKYFNAPTDERPIDYLDLDPKAFDPDSVKVAT